MTLLDELKNEMKTNRQFWNYYDVKFEDVFENEEAARDFIIKYFQNGSKLSVLKEWKKITNDYMNRRNIHTVNVFFIGAYLQRHIDENIEIKSEQSSNYTFSYLWYLLCLAHDLGYVYENESQSYLAIPNDNVNNTRKMYKEACRLRTKWYQDLGIGILNRAKPFCDIWIPLNRESYDINPYNNFIEYNNGTIVKKCRYSQRIKNNYFNYRIYEMNTLDHGIIGADYFYSKMLHNYKLEYLKTVRHGNLIGDYYSFYNEDGHSFCIEQLKIFAYIADCIASHNIFMANNEQTQRDKYMKYGLENLLQENFIKISYEDNPLLFVLCVADTIEPSKRFPSYGNEEILELLSIGFDKSRNLLYVEIDEELFNSDEGIRYISGIEELEEWCDINVNVQTKDFRVN